MRHQLFNVLYVLAMAATIITVDVLLRHHFWARLGTNIAIVAVFGAVHVVFLRQTLR